MKVAAVVVDNGEPNLSKCILSLKKQARKLDEIILCPGPKTDLNLAKSLGVRVLEPKVGIGKSRVQGILASQAEYIISCDSDSLYDERYVEYAVASLDAGAKAVKAGIILPLEWANPLALFESAFSLPIPYEFALAFKRSEFLRLGLVEEAEQTSDPRWDIGWRVVTGLNALPDFRMVAYTKMPTYGANYVVETYVPSLLAGLTPIFGVAGIIGASSLV